MECNHECIVELFECDHCPREPARKRRRGDRKRAERAVGPRCSSGAELERELDDLLVEVTKYHDSLQWFSSVVLYLAPPIHSTNPDSQEIGRITLKRLSIEAGMHGAGTSEVLNESVTHVITYHKDEKQILQPDWVIRSLGGQREQDIVKFGGWWHRENYFIKVVYQDWIVDCLAAGRVLPVSGFRAVRELSSLKPRN